MSATTAAHPSTTTPPTGGRQGRVPGWLAACGMLFAVGWGGNEFTPLLTMYRQESGLSSQAVTILLGAYVVGIVPALLVGGPLSDRFGRRPLMLPAPVLCVGGSALLAAGGLLPGAGGTVLLLAGRVLSGLALGLVMAVGTSWVKELSQPPFDDVDPGAGARRAALSLTLGFCLGAAVAAALAQFGPFRTVLPYAVNILITATVSLCMVRAPETRAPQTDPRPLRQDLRIPSATHRRFLLVVVPMAPWVFGTAASAYAILATLLAPKVPGFEVGFAGLLCLVGLGCGLGSQQVAKRLDTPHSSRAVVVALACTALGMLLAVWAAITLTVLAAIIGAAVLGTAYGLLLVSGLQEVQRIAGPDGLAGLTAVFYSLTYVGFFVPAVLAALARWFSYPVMFAAGAVLALVSLGIVALCWRRHLPLATVVEAAAARAVQPD
ncbi:MFS transporter [Tersicoccus sp. MR15.9]|uniref:MFS transporter n=1 Tax=Tersicoccus mangrovi TaxID=3121635 RepID=UPI002FE50606